MVWAATEISIMSHFESINPDEPATIENVLMAVMRLRAYDEATLAELISKGRLHELFPFRPQPAKLPPDTSDEADVPEASPHSLTDSRYAELVKSSMHSGDNAPQATRADELANRTSEFEARSAVVTEAGVDGAAILGKSHDQMGDKNGARDVIKEVRNKIRLFRDRVIVKCIDEERKTASGIVIPDAAAEKPAQGEVLIVGNGKILEDGKVRPLDVKVGDRILFGKYSGTTVKIEGTEYIVMREDDILGVIDGGKR